MNCSEEEIFYAKQPQAHLIIKTKVLVTKARRRTDRRMYTLTNLKATSVENNIVLLNITTV